MEKVNKKSDGRRRPVVMAFQPMMSIIMLVLAAVLMQQQFAVVDAAAAAAAAGGGGLFGGKGGGKTSTVPPGGSTTTASEPRILAKNEEETADMDVSMPLSQQPDVDKDRDGPLLEDIELLSEILSGIINTEDPNVHELFDEFRNYGVLRASNPDGDALEKLIKKAEGLSASEQLGLMRSFSIMLNLVNSAEVHHRNRLLHEHESVKDVSGGPLPLVEDSIRGTMDALLSSGLATPSQIYDMLTRQNVEIVLTAHPTQVQRKSLLRKYSKITNVLANLDRPDITPFEIRQAHDDLRRIISSVWGADEIRRQKPTPQQEASGGNAVIESVLWDAVPAYLRKLDSQCRMTLNGGNDHRLPVDICPIKFASWIGGDRDGNPNVTPDVTLEVVLQQRLRAVRLYLKELYQLSSEIAISSRFSDEMHDLASQVGDDYHKREKYRRVIGHLIKRLVRTARQCERQIYELEKKKNANGNDNVMAQPQTIVDEMASGWQDVEPIEDASEIMKPLKIMYDSLVETGFDLVADGRLSDIIRRVAVFGLSLAPLDIREESTKHTEALDAVTGWLGIGSYKEWSEEVRINWLTAELSGNRPLFHVRDLDRAKSIGFDDGVVKTLRTFQVASNLRKSESGAYVISQAQTASDVLAVMLLQKQFGMTAKNGNLMRVVPLFETLLDLTNASKVLETLFSIPVYAGAIRGKQEVMVGYSDSAKDAGRLAACWAQYKAQEEMSAVAIDNNVEITFFHGKGGTVSRGGNPSVYRAIMSHPPNTICGRFRVTEQGEMITQNFGAQSIAERTLDIYTAAICRESFAKQVKPKQKWRDMMEKISDVSCTEYRHLVREEPRFVPYFRQATPELELGRLNIGSRPAKRNPKGGIESLRAIPWTFAWTQTRTHLPAWLGVGGGLHTTDPEELETLREMYTEWPWFRETIDLIAMILSKTDYSISTNYDNQLVDKTPELISLGEEVKDKLVQARQAVLDVTESKDVSGTHVALMRASNTIRHPFLDPVNVCQAEILKRLRAMDKRGDSLSPEELEEKYTLEDALIVTINGIAQGMRNSG